MGWKNLFREFEMERKQKKVEEIRRVEEEKRIEKERMEMVREYSGRVNEVIKEFSRATGHKIVSIRKGKWASDGCFERDARYLWIQINPSSVSIEYYSSPSSIGMKYSEDIPLEIFSEEKLAKALVNAYRKM